MKRLLLAATVLSITSAANAYEHGDLIIRAGAANANPDASSSHVRLAGTTIAGSSVDVDDNTQLGLTASYMLNESLAIGLLAATPFKHNVTAQGIGVDQVATVEHLPPTLTLQYFPLSASSAVQPYLGVGVNYTTFFSEKTTNELNGALGQSDISLDDSFGLAVEAGVGFTLNQHWIINAAVWKLDLDTEATIDSPTGTVGVDVDIDPWVYMLGVGYKF
jgi:outer membrane protein